MYDLGELSRRSLESVYGADRLIPVSDGRLAGIADPDTRDVMRSFGLPKGASPLFGLGYALEEFRTMGVRLDYQWRLEERYDPVPPGADRWIELCDTLDDTIVLDPDTGQVNCLPQDGAIHLVSTSFRRYVHFMYIYESQLRYFDLERGEESMFDQEGALARVEAAFRAVDPAPLENPRSRWYDVLMFIVEPEFEYYQTKLLNVLRAERGWPELP